MHNWQIQSPYHYNPEKKDSLENLIKSILKNRGITKEEDIESFLHPDLKNINLLIRHLLIIFMKNYCC